MNNPGYYQTLLDTYPKKIPFPYEEAIDLDLHRTFPEIEYYQHPENLQKLKNILMAFSMRNITIGYCQGFNYIVAKLLLIFKNEENAFWIFTQIAENYLPFDYYIKFTGVRTDMEIVKKIIKSSIPGIDMNSELCISNLITRCFISLFSQNVNDKILYSIWDAFFIYGNITLYRAFIWAVFLLFDITKMKKYSIETIHSVLTEKLQKVEDTNTLNYFLMMYSRFNEAYIKHYRNKLTEKTLGDNYINKDNDPALMDKCDLSLPFCLCNKDGEIVQNFMEFNSLKSVKPIEILDDYFFKNCKNKKKEINHDLTIDELIIERQKHYCKKKNDNFDIKKSENTSNEEKVTESKENNKNEAKEEKSEKVEEVSNNEKKIEQTDDDIKEKNENKCQEKKVEAVNIEKNNKDESKNDIIIEDEN